MTVSRKIGDIEFDVDITQANELYFSQSFAERIVEEGISGILKAVYDNANIRYPLLSAFIELTDYCNFSCPFCYVNESGMKHSSIPRFDEGFKNTLDYMINQGLIYCVLSGGECLTHPDFKQIYKYLKENGVLVTVFTNGSLIDNTTLSLFSHYKPFKIEISIYGKDDVTYRATTNSSSVSCECIYDNVIKLKNAGINVVCKTPITSLTESFYREIEEWCKVNIIPYYTGYELMPSNSGKSRNEYLATEQLRLELRKKSDGEFFADKEMIKIATSDFSRKLNFDCSAGIGDCYISAALKLMPCMKANGIDEWTFDITASGGIKDAYEQMSERISFYKDKPLVHCNGCVHHKVCQECFMTQYEYQGDELAEHRCQYCKQLKDFMANPIKT